MQPQKREFFDDNADGFSRTIHDAAAALIYARTLAETLAKHVPVLVAVSRSKYPAIEAQIPPYTLDTLSSIPTEIIDLCEAARAGLQAIGNGPNTTENLGRGSTYGLRSRRKDLPIDEISGMGASILLVEDEEMVRYVLSQTLRAKGCRVTATADGEEALKFLEQQEFDLILMDLHIPGMSGLETAERIRQSESAQGRYTRIVGLTASPLVEDQRRARAAGMDAVLVKPLDDRSLQSLLS